MKKIRKSFILIICTLLFTACSGKSDTKKQSEQDPLESAIHTAVLENNEGHYNPGTGDSKPFGCESHIILDKKETEDSVTVYTMVLYEEYQVIAKELTVTGAMHSAAALTFSKDNEGNYTLEEYWLPGDGEDYLNDIREEFPSGIYDDAIDTQKYIKKQKEVCIKQAEEHFKEAL